MPPNFPVNQYLSAGNSSGIYIRPTNHTANINFNTYPPHFPNLKSTSSVRLQVQRQLQADVQPEEAARIPPPGKRFDLNCLLESRPLIAGVAVVLLPSVAEECAKSLTVTSAT